MRNLTFLLLPTLLLLSCGRSEQRPPAEIPDYVKLHQPLWLEPDSTDIYLGDFIYGTPAIDSVVLDREKVSPGKDQMMVRHHASADDPRLMLLTIWTAGDRQDVVLKRSTRRKVEMRFDPAGKAYEKVQIKGEFNGWVPSKTNLVLEDGIWHTTLSVNEGKYQYLLVLDGSEQLDPACPVKVDNNAGGFNSLLEVGDPDAGLRCNIAPLDLSGDSIILETHGQPTQFIVLWNNTALDPSTFTAAPGRLSFPLPEEAARYRRSHIRVFAAGGDGLTNDVLIPLQHGKPLTDPSLLSREDHHAGIIYNVFVDRFLNGDPSNDKRLNEDTVLPPANYMGGDIRGIMEVVDAGYFDELGVNSLWISPIVRNTDGAFGLWKQPRTRFSAYHGYWPTSFTQIDSHFGRPEEFRALVNTLHAHDMNLFLDVVANHVHQEHPYYQAHPDHVTQLHLPDGSLNLERWDEYRLTTWFDVFLPTLDLENPEVSRMLADSLYWWLEEYQIDGFRHDAAKHIPLTFWRMLTEKINSGIVAAEQRPVYQLGETYGGVELIGSYIGSGLLDAQFDFNVYDAALGAFAGGQDFDVLAGRLEESLRHYGAHNLMGYITGNQDRGRFISYAGGDLLFGEDAKKAGWTRNIGVGDTIGYRKLQMLMAFNMTTPGIPVIFYGDEFGMPGGNDPDCRRMMRFGESLNSMEMKNLAVTRRLTSLRRENMALLYGDMLYLKTEGKLLSYARKYFGNTVLVAFNNSPEAVEFPAPEGVFPEGVSLLSHFGNPVRQDEDGVFLSLAPYSFEIITYNP